MAGKKSEKYVVKVGNNLEHIVDGKRKTFRGGETVALTDEQATTLLKHGVIVHSGSEEGEAHQQIADQIPSNFPHADKLSGVGIVTFSALRKKVNKLASMDGFDDGLASEVEVALAAHDGD